MMTWTMDRIRLPPWRTGLVCILITTGLFLLVVKYCSRSAIAQRKKPHYKLSGVQTHIPLRSPSTMKPTDIKVSDATFNGVRVRIYTPVLQSNSTQPFPGLIHYHGGAWLYGGLDANDGLARHFCLLNVAVIVAVGYRLVQFPVPVEDCALAAKYFMSNAKQFNVHPDHIGVIGESAGGNLAAAISLKLRDEKFEPTLKVQLLLHPVLQGFDFQLPSMQLGNGLSAKGMALCVSSYIEGSSANQTVYINNEHVSPAAKKQFAKTYLNVSRLPEKYRRNYTRTDMDKGDAVYYEKIKSKLLNPYFSPLFATSLTNLAPALVFTTENDPLRDEGILYVWRLREAGNNVQHTNDDHGHHQLSMGAIFDNVIKQFVWNNL